MFFLQKTLYRLEALTNQRFKPPHRQVNNDLEGKMSKAEFEEVSGVDAAEAMSGEALGSDISSQLGSVSEDTILHVYIVFDADTSIDAGVAAIEEKALEGNSLEVTRKDATGNAVVAIVTEKQRKAIAELDEVKSVKINEEEGTLSGEGAATDASEAATAEETNVSDTTGESKNSDSEATAAATESSTQKEYADGESTASNATTEASVQQTSDNKTVGTTPIIAGSIVVLILAILVAYFIGKK